MASKWYWPGGSSASYAEVQYNYIYPSSYILFHILQILWHYIISWIAQRDRYNYTSYILFSSLVRHRGWSQYLPGYFETEISGSGPVHLSMITICLEGHWISCNWTIRNRSCICLSDFIPMHVAYEYPVSVRPSHTGYPITE